jgi:outer membrane protein assembly factor BamB
MTLHLRIAAGALGAGLVLTLALRAEDWPMLGRAPSRNAVSTEKGAPVEWLAGDKPQGIRWIADLGSACCTSPIVSGWLVWVGTNNGRPRDPKVKGDHAVLMCFRASDGAFLWQYASPRLENPHQDFPNGALTSVPLVAGDRLYFLSNRAEVVCLDIGLLRRGKGEPTTLWKLDLRKELGVSPVGPPCPGVALTGSPASYRGRLYVTTGNGVGPDFVTLPAPEAPSLVCLDCETGKVLWADRSPGRNILHSQWSSPLVVEVQGRGQVIAAQGDGWVRAFDPLTGELLWKFDTNPKSSVWKTLGRGTRNHLPATPVFHDNRVYVACGQAWEGFDGVGHLWCIDPTRTPKNRDKDLSPVGDNFDPNAAVNRDSGLIWHYGGPTAPRAGPGQRDWAFGRTLSSVVIHNDLIVAVEQEGYVHCLDACTGRLCWVHDLADAIHASPLIADDKVYVPTSGGEMHVLALSRRLTHLAKNEFEQPLYASPVFANRTLYVASNGKLYAIGP